MQALQARMKYLRKGEAIAALALPLVLLFNWWRTDQNLAWAERSAAVALVSFILLQGVLYWHLKLRCIDQHRALPGYFKGLFRAFQYVNMVLIGAMLIVLSTSSAVRADLFWPAFMLTLAILEQINYYHYQLMYDTRAALAYLRRNRRLRTAALALDLARNR